MRGQFRLTLRRPSEKIRASAYEKMMRRAFPMQLVALRRRYTLGRAAARIAALLFALAVVEEGRADEVAEPGTRLAEAEATTPRNDAVAEAEEETESPGPAGEAESQSSLSGVEVIHVKGRGVGQIEMEVQSSVTQFDASTIQALGAQNVSDLARVTPNVNIVQPGSTQATFFVRGIGLSDFSSNAAGAVSIFQDDVGLNAPAIQTGQLFDVENVDIVRGPQGTGPFRNASAGAIMVQSRRPTGNYTAQLRSSIGQYRTIGDKGARHALIQDYEGALELPIVSDALSARFAFRLREAEPYRTNNCGYSIPFDQRVTRPGGDPVRLHAINSQMCGEGENASIMYPPGKTSQIPFPLPYSVNDEHNWAARGTLRFQPPGTETVFFLNGHGSRLAQDSTLGQVVGTRHAPGTPTDPVYGQRGGNDYQERDAFAELEALCNRDPITKACRNQYVGTQLAKSIATRPLDQRPYRGDYDRVGDDTRDAYGAFASGQGQIFGDVTLFGLTSFDQYVRTTDNDTDFTPERLFELVQDDRAWQLWNELKLDGELESEPIEWNIGGYYLKEHLYNNGNLLIGTSLPIEIHRTYTQDIDSLGAWGEFSWDFADDLTLEGGVRYNYEAKDFKFHVYQINKNLFTPQFSVNPDERRNSSKAWQTPTGQITLTYHIDQSTSAYAKYSRGFKAGHFNALATENLDKPPADPEYNDAWEVGLRGGWFDGRMSIGTAAFYYRYENYQVFLFTDSSNATTAPTLEILNAKQAENYGVELEGQIAPLRGWAPRLFDGLRLSGNFGWLHGEYLDFTTTSFFNLGPGFPSVPVSVSYAGLPLQNAPEFKASGTLEWTFDLGRWGYLIPRYDINWTDDAFFDPNQGHGSIAVGNRPALPDYAIGQKAYYLHNVRLAYRTPTGNVELAGWIRNIDDTVYKNFAFDASKFSSITINFPGQPRSIGFDLTVTF
jgi:iron complex outermembrane receptor protein